MKHVKFSMLKVNQLLSNATGTETMKSGAPWENILLNFKDTNQIAHLNRLVRLSFITIYHQKLLGCTFIQWKQWRPDQTAQMCSLVCISTVCKKGDVVFLCHVFQLIQQDEVRLCQYLSNNVKWLVWHAANLFSLFLSSQIKSSSLSSTIYQA